MKEIVLSHDEIVQICTRLAKELEERFKNSDTIPVFVGVLKGACPFFMELIKHYSLPMKTDFIQVSSYDGTSSTGVIHLKQDISIDIRNKDVVLIEDIIDTGLTLSYLKQYIEIKYNPKSVTVVTLIDKKPLRRVDFKCDHVGVTLNENKFLVGFGFDYKEVLRNVDYVYVPSKKEIAELDKLISKDNKM